MTNHLYPMARAHTMDSGTASCELQVGGMDCASCATTIETALKQLDGVQNVRVDVVRGRVRVDYVGDRLARGDLVNAIQRVGFRPDGAEPLRETTAASF